MSKFLQVIGSSLEIAAGVVVGVVASWTGVGLYIAAQLITLGTASLLSGVGTLLSGTAQSTQGSASVGGIAVALRNPIKSQDVIYGRASAGGVVAHHRSFAGVA